MFAERLGRLVQEFGAAGLDAYLVSNPVNLSYLAGLQATAGCLLVRRDAAALIVDFRYATAAQRAAAALPNASVVVAKAPLDYAIADAVSASGASKVGVEGSHLTVSRFNALSGRITSQREGESTGGRAELVPFERTIERLRAVKDAGEIATLREAAARLTRVAAQVPQFAVAGRTEREVAADIDAAIRTAGFERIAFETIVASGPNGALPHARPTTRRLETGDGVVLDFGGVYDGYCVDLTRTVQIGAAPPAFRRLFDAVADAHAAAIAAVKPGARAVDIDGAARRTLTQHGLGEAFGHGTGHGLGLEVHEEPRISPHAPAEETVVPGMVFTIEPGAYVAGIGGVRIEDDVLVTQEGCEVLTR